MDTAFKKFVLRLFIVSGIGLLGALIYMLAAGKNDWRGPIFTSFIINFLNVYAGALILVRNRELEPKKFINVVLGSMVLRMFINLLLIFLCLQVFKFDRLVFVISFFAFYILLLILEITFVTKDFAKKPENKVN
jgi:signal transduction histidine kinase